MTRHLPLAAEQAMENVSTYACVMCMHTTKVSEEILVCWQSMMRHLALAAEQGMGYLSAKELALVLNAVVTVCECTTCACVTCVENTCAKLLAPEVTARI